MSFDSLSKEDKEQIELGLRVVNLLVEKKYDLAYAYLSDELKSQSTFGELLYSVVTLEKMMNNMTEHMYNVKEIFVNSQDVKENADPSKDGYIYIPIEVEGGDSEAISVEFKYDDSKLVISDIEFGRP
ncbi:MAG: hypothetical protein Q9M36_11520 [Sulfurovum sp.]|nr:hypothetical protein [Sulfurovum sp.]